MIVVIFLLEVLLICAPIMAESHSLTHCAEALHCKPFSLREEKPHNIFKVLLFAGPSVKHIYTIYIGNENMNATKVH